MLDSLYIGASGMHTQQVSLDVIANNLANVNTSGYKKNRIDFEDLLYRNLSTPATLASGVQGVDRLGAGVAIAGTDKIFTAGDLKKTDGTMDLAVRGDGFFQVTQTDGTTAYTRNGSLQINRDGLLVTAEGYPITPSVQVPPDATNITVDGNGKISATVPGSAQPIEIGQLELATFTNPSGLSPMGDNLYLATSASGDAVGSSPGDNGTGTIAQGFLEASNVNLVEEMVNLVMAQRAYEINAKVVQASDQMLSISNNLQR